MKKYWESLNKKTLVISLIIGLIGTVAANFGIGCYYGCGLGTDPISVYVDGLHVISHLTYGQISTINNVILTILIIIFERKHLGIMTVLTVFISGPLIDIFNVMISGMFPLESTPLVMRMIMLAVALVTFAVGTGMIVACKMGIGCFSFLPIWLSDLTHISLSYTQMFTDACFLIVGWLLGGVVGIGTIVGVLGTGPILGWALTKTENYLERYDPLVRE
ncbi:MAG: hypothetical protein IJM79_08045 [Erysipelotrichaceae bacterium]|nr:hypothetical protein [Erysipelotrichaceae bacterium]